MGAVLGPSELVGSVVNVFYVAINFEERKHEGDINETVEHNTRAATNNSGDRSALFLKLDTTGEWVAISDSDPRFGVIHEHVDKEGN